MGLSLFSDGCSCPQPPNPNPLLYSIIKVQKIGNKFEIAEVKYKGCTTFNGRKLLLLRRNILIEKDGHYYYKVEKIDPHLLGEDHIVMARFEPTEEGWELAELCAKHLTEKDSI